MLNQRPLTLMKRKSISVIRQTEDDKQIEESAYKEFLDSAMIKPRRNVF